MSPPNPHILALDTATFTQSLALMQGDQLIVEWSIEARRGGHSTDQLAAAQWLVHRGGLQLKDLDALVVGLGPGSFTGLRVGLAMMKGLAFAYQKPLFGACSLEAAALSAAPYAAPNALLCPCFDARKSEVYAALYRAAWTDAGRPSLIPVIEPCVAPPDALIERLNAHMTRQDTVHFFGTGAVLYAALFGAVPRARVVPLAAMGLPRALCLGLLALPHITAGQPPSLATLEPLYIRPSDAEIALEAGKIAPLREI